MAKFYCYVVGVVLLLGGIAGFVTSAVPLPMHHNAVHVLSGIVALWAGMSGGGKYAAPFAKIFGAVYALLGIGGFLGIRDLGPIMLGLTTQVNIVHLVVGLAGLAAGFTTKASAEQSKMGRAA
ncbi:MAG: DUF4383 domain-containing protein [Acidobacteriia bacterium]|nr:DUF4383 domain-containing protein [Terriglobia bacterium]